MHPFGTKAGVIRIKTIITVLQMENIISYVPVSFVSHPSYNNKTEDNDFAIITLSTDVSFNSTIGTICLPLGAGTVHENK